MNIYIAAPIFTPEQVEVVELIKNAAEYNDQTVFSPYHNSQDIFNGRAPKDCTPEERAQVLNDNITNLDWCDVLFAWVGGMGGFTDPGVIWEMGYAHAARKFTVAYVDPELDANRKSMNLMLAGTVQAAVTDRTEVADFFAWLPEHGPFWEARKLFPTTVFDADKEPVV